MKTKGAASLKGSPLKKQAILQREQFIIWSFYFDMFDAVVQYQIDQLITRIIALCGNFVQFGKNFFTNTHGDDSVAVISAFFDFQWFIIHPFHLTVHIIID